MSAVGEAKLDKKYMEIFESYTAKVNAKELAQKKLRGHPWTEYQSCYIQGERNEQKELDGRAVVIMPGCFVLTAIFKNNVPQQNHFMQSTTSETVSANFERKLPENCPPLFPRDSTAIYWLFMRESAYHMNTAAAQVDRLVNTRASTNVLKMKEL